MSRQETQTRYRKKGKVREMLVAARGARYEVTEHGLHGKICTNKK